MPAKYITIVELDVFRKAAAKLLTQEELGQLIDFLAQFPQAGDLIQGTGGFRKLRWARSGIGKRGGSRVIYFYYHSGFPLFLYTIYAKNEMADLTQAEKNLLGQYAKKIVKDYGHD